MQMVLLSLSNAPFYDPLTFTLLFLSYSLSFPLSGQYDVMSQKLSIPWDHNQSAKVLSPHWTS